ATPLFHQPKEKAPFADVPCQHCSRDFLGDDRRAMVENNLSHLRPLFRRQNPAGRKQRIARTVLEIALPAEPQPAQNAPFEEMSRRLIAQFLLQHLVKDLERGRSINTEASRFRYYS